MNYFHNKLISKKNMRSSKQDTHRPKENDNDDFWFRKDTDP